NNNAYCQDGEVSWVKWYLNSKDRELLDFTRRCIQIFKSNPVLRRRSFFAGHPMTGAWSKDVIWLRAGGGEMKSGDWADHNNHVLGMLMHGHATDEVDDRGRPIFGEALLLLLNGGTRLVYFHLPGLEGQGVWHEILNTARSGTRVVRGEAVNLGPHSLILLSPAVQP
ncbi:MAG: glycogen debranching protein GlgX, partial [Actinomycetota bacterium]